MFNQVTKIVIIRSDMMFDKNCTEEADNFSDHCFDNKVKTVCIFKKKIISWHINSAFKMT